MKDLFGNDIPDNPPMDAPLPFLAWELRDRLHNVIKIWAARTKEEMIACFTETIGMPPCHPDDVHQMRDARAWEPYLKGCTGPCCFWTQDCGSFC